jgi:hypothetical protein
MLSEAKRVADLLSRYFGLNDALDQAEYLLSISDIEDAKEWLLAAVVADESTPDDIDIDEFLSEVFQIKNEALTDVAPKKVPTVRATAAKTTSRAPPCSNKAELLEPNLPPVIDLVPVHSKPKVIPQPRKLIREKCFCLAKTEIDGHPLIGNCLRCGRIVCDAEDYGPCLTCSAPKESLHWLDVSETADNRASGAIAHKDRLIQYDREGAKRTQIYDDSTDWFAEGSDIWKGKAERQEALRKAREFDEKKREAKLGMKVEIDFATGQISVKDKAEEIRKVEQERDEELASWVTKADSGSAVIPKPGTQSGNVLNKDSQELLDLIREKLGNPRKTMFTSPSENSSWVSILDDW